MSPWTVACQAPLSIEFSRPEYSSGWPSPSPGDLPNPGIESRSPTLQVDSLPPKPPEKLKNTGMGSLSLFQGIFPTQESNRGLLRCRQILYQLSYQGSPGSAVRELNPCLPHDRQEYSPLCWSFLSPPSKCSVKYYSIQLFA